LPSKLRPLDANDAAGDGHEDGHSLLQQPVGASLNFSTLNLAKKSEQQISSARQLFIARRRDLEEAHPRDHLSCG
jgi:hypothetical protein